MGAISVTDARGLYTKMLIEVYKERVSPTAFLRSFFKVKESPTKEIAIEVQRGTEKIAVDVERGTEGNRNSFTRSTEKIFVPPYYREYFDATELDLYDRLFASDDSMIDSAILAAFIDSVADKLRLLQDKIERAYEKQCADVLTTGIVTLQSGITIDFKRKSTSKVDKGAGAYWATGTVSPYTDLENACKFLRTVGKAGGAVFHAIFGELAFQALMDNTIVKAKNDIAHINLDAIAAPQRNSVGAAYHGKISCGSYIVHLWTYPEVYDNASGVSTAYLNSKKVVVLPEMTKFTMAFATVPQLLSKAGAAPKKGAFLVGDYIDERGDKHVFDIKSAGVAIPVAVDQIYTLQVVA